MGKDSAAPIIQPRLIERTVSREQWRDLILDSVLAYDNGDPTLFDSLLTQIVALDKMINVMAIAEEKDNGVINIGIEWK